MVLGLDHCEATGALQIGIDWKMLTLPPRVSRPVVKQVIRARRSLRQSAVTRGHPQLARIESMKARRMAYWWFRFVVSGRFLEKFLKLRRP
jgi:hypothetical protein